MARNASYRYLNSPEQRRHYTSLSKASARGAELRSMTSTIRDQRQRAALAQLVADLDDDERQLLVLRVEQEMPFKDIAAIMDTTVQTAKKRYSRLKDKLRRATKHGPPGSSAT